MPAAPAPVHISRAVSTGISTPIHPGARQRPASPCPVAMLPQNLVEHSSHRASPFAPPVRAPSPTPQGQPLFFQFPVAKNNGQLPPAPQLGAPVGIARSPSAGLSKTKIVSSPLVMSNAAQRASSRGNSRGHSPAPAVRQQKITTYAVGTEVDYFYDRFRCWLPGRVTSVDAESGAIRIDGLIKQSISYLDQRNLLRKAVVPQAEHCAWIRSMTRQGSVMEQGDALFIQFAVTGSNGAAIVMNEQSAYRCAREIDRLLGSPGSILKIINWMEKAGRQFLSKDEFRDNFFWNHVDALVTKHFQALRPEEALPYRREDPAVDYDVIKQLGVGTYGCVKLVRHKEDKVKRALKILDKVQPGVDGMSGVLEVEIQHLRVLDHPNIVKLYECFEDSKHIYIVMDFCSGGDLQHALDGRRKQKQAFPEELTKKITKQVLLAINHVHCHGIVHLDLKSANIMVMPDGNTLPPSSEDAALTLCDTPADILASMRVHVMVIDLGVAQIFKPGNFKSNRPMGTPVTMAPEVWRGEITPKADVFSIGTVLFELLTLKMPWTVGADIEKAVKYWHAKPPTPWDQAQVRGYSPTARDLCDHMLNQNRQMRLSCALCLEHQFFQDPRSMSKRDPVIADDLFLKLQKVPGRSLFYMSQAYYIARRWPANQQPSTKHSFQDLDVKFDGRLAVATVADALVQKGAEKGLAELIAKCMDLNRDGYVDWTEWSACSLQLSGSGLEREVQKIFAKADADKDGCLDKEDVADMLAGQHLRDPEFVNDIMQEMSGTNFEIGDDPKIDYKAFRKSLRTRPNVEEAALAPESSENSANSSSMKRWAEQTFGTFANATITTAAAAGLPDEQLSDALNWFDSQNKKWFKEDQAR